MGKWKPAPRAAAEAFALATGTLAGVELRKMFGCECIFANGKMMAGLHEVGLVLRLPDAARGELLRLDGATPFEPMPGRVMREYVVVPPALLADVKELRSWIERSRAYVVALPAKKTAAKRRTTKAAVKRSVKRPAATGTSARTRRKPSR